MILSESDSNSNPYFMMPLQSKLTQEQIDELLSTLKARFEKHMHRHADLNWKDVQSRLQANPDKLWSLNEMENTGGEPDVVAYDQAQDTYLFFDCAAESPKQCRSICYDQDALESRKENKPKHSALGMAEEMGIKILNEEQYRLLQTLGHFDMKTSSWIETPAAIRALGGALFADYRYATVFVYHNGAESYYAARGFRGALEV
jgi:hypothetical protein